MKVNMFLISVMFRGTATANDREVSRYLPGMSV
jgi:hypothetical protein